MRRRDCLTLMASALVAAHGLAVPSVSIGQVEHSNADQDDWQAWKAAFLTEDGRIVDHLQQNASHSEGQGYGMTLAVWFGDADAFRQMHRWTVQNLAVRQDPLLSWRWLPRQKPHVAEYNNASDGDLFFAWALLAASQKFGDGLYRDQAAQIARFLAESCIRVDPRDPGRLVLLPAAEGFVDVDTVTVNPSYYMPLAMRDLGEAFDIPALVRCADDGVALIAEIATAGLVPDWIEVRPNGWSPSLIRPSTSGYDALRTALFLTWSGVRDHPAVRRAAALYSGSDDLIPTVVALSGAPVLASSDLPGYQALASLVRCASGAYPNPPNPRFSPGQPYYPATLQQFVRVARQRIGQDCAPS